MIYIYELTVNVIYLWNEPIVWSSRSSLYVVNPKMKINTNLI